MSLASTDVRSSPYQLIPDISQTLVTNAITNSTITTSRVFLDGNFLDTTGSGGTASLLLNGTVIAGTGGLTSTIANWAQFGANSTIVAATGGGSGGGIIMNTGSISTLSASALSVSSINGTNFAGPQNGVYRAVTGNIAVQNTGAGLQTLPFTLNNNVPMVAGTWYLLSAKINITLSQSNVNPSNTWFFRYGLSGGTLQYQQDSPVFLSPVVWAEQNSNNVNQFSYFFTTLANCANSGSITSLSVIANLVSGTNESEFTWSCPSFTIAPLGPSLN